jgi:hypothetical protein
MRVAAFYVLLLVPLVLWVLLVVPVAFSSDPTLSDNLVYGIVSISPIVSGDLSIFGEVTPVVLAGAIIALMPNSKSEIRPVAIFLAVLSYLLFIHLTVFFTSGEGVGVISANFDNIEEPKKILLGVISNVRVVMIVVAASIIGFKVKRTSS